MNLRPGLEERTLKEQDASFITNRGKEAGFKQGKKNWRGKIRALTIALILKLCVYASTSEEFDRVGKAVFEHPYRALEVSLEKIAHI